MLRRERAEAKRAKHRRTEERRRARKRPPLELPDAPPAKGQANAPTQPQVQTDQGFETPPTEPVQSPARIASLEAIEEESSQEAEPPQAMIARLYAAFTGQVDQLETKLKALMAESGTGLGDIDRTVKTLAGLARTLTVLMDMMAEQENLNAAEESGLDDPDHLRAELAQRLERLCGGGAD